MERKAVPLPSSVASTHRPPRPNPRHRAYLNPRPNAGAQHVGRFRDLEEAARAYDRAAYYLLGPEGTAFNFSPGEAAADLTPPNEALTNLLADYSDLLAVRGCCCCCPAARRCPRLRQHRACLARLGGGVGACVLEALGSHHVLMSVSCGRPPIGRRLCAACVCSSDRSFLLVAGQRCCRCRCPQS